MQISARIPLPSAVFTLSKVFKAADRALYVVGGAVRDFLMHSHDGTLTQYDPKDIDLATNAVPQDVARILSDADIRNFEKGESFGVWVARLHEENYEIATFREDIGSTDGRHPDQVRWATPETDYRRRDLTMNALFYEIPASSDEDGKIIDHGNGTGLLDVENKVVRVVGDPFERFQEDKLRILRLVRFHCQYNVRDIFEVLDDRTRAAVEHFKDLRGHGISGPRIQQEFVSGILKSLDISAYLKCQAALGLFQAIFPGMNVNPEINYSPGTRNPSVVVVVMAYILRSENHKAVRHKLNKLEWPNEIADEVAFLIESHSLLSLTKEQSSEVLARHANKLNEERRKLASEFGELVVKEVHANHWNHFSGYCPRKFDGLQIQNELGLPPGPEIGQEIRRRQTEDYERSFRMFEDCK